MEFAQEWIATRPGPRLTIHRVCVEATRVYQEQHTKPCAVQAKQKAQINEVVSCGRVQMLQSFPMLRLLSGELENEFFLRLSVLLTEQDMWRHIIADMDKTVENNVYAF